MNSSKPPLCLNFSTPCLSTPSQATALSSVLKPSRRKDSTCPCFKNTLLPRSLTRSARFRLVDRLVLLVTLHFLRTHWRAVTARCNSWRQIILANSLAGPTEHSERGHAQAKRGVDALGPATYTITAAPGGEVRIFDRLGRCNPASRVVRQLSGHAIRRNPCVFCLLPGYGGSPFLMVSRSFYQFGVYVPAMLLGRREGTAHNPRRQAEAFTQI